MTQQEEFNDALRQQRVWDVELPEFAADRTPETPLPLFQAWFLDAVAAGQPEPHTMTLATADSRGAPDIRTVMLHAADPRGWHFAGHAGSRKGRQLAANPRAALHFYWPARGRQIRIRGTVTPAPPGEAQAGLHARSTGALAAALVGHQSEVLGSEEELGRASEAAWEYAQAHPAAPVPSWTLYILAPDEAEFFQGDTRRRHVRLTYSLNAQGSWDRGLLWP